MRPGYKDGYKYRCEYQFFGIKTPFEQSQFWTALLNKGSSHNFLISFDSFLFEIDSCCELITSIIRMIYNHIGYSVTKKQIGKILKTVIEDAGKSSSWFESLQNLRNYFIHEGAPYFAVDVTIPDSFELLVMRENLKSFDDESKFVRLRPEFESILEGFFNANKILQIHVIDLLS